jgi:hypothetical protein
MQRRYIRIDTRKPFYLTHELRNLLFESGYVASLWHADDVMAVRPDLNFKQSMRVLEDVIRSHDASFGINWDIIKYQAEELFPEAETASPAKGATV